MTFRTSTTRESSEGAGVQAKKSDPQKSQPKTQKPAAKPAVKTKVPEPQLEVANTGKHLSACVEQAMQAYLNDIDDEDVTNIYDMVLAEVEKPLLTTVMKHVGNNQSRATRMLGLNRGTLRKKLQQYKLI